MVGSVESSFKGKDFVTVRDVQTDQIAELFDVTTKFLKDVPRAERSKILQDLNVRILFFQPSTRTFTSFVTAAQNLGANTLGINEMQQFSSASKGEDLPDTVMSFYTSAESDLIVLRHPDNNSSKVAAEASPVPVVNAGSGTAEHPTQALLDLYTIYNNFGQFDNLHVVMVGDLKYGRTIKSLAELLAVVGQNNRITFVSPKELAAPPEFLEGLRGKIEFEETNDIQAVQSEGDVFYWTRVQEEWFKKEDKLDEYNQIKDSFILTPELTQHMKPDAIFMHPLPRVNEIDRRVDNDPRAKYFEQMSNGLYVRMALLERILNPTL